MDVRQEVEDLKEGIKEGSNRKRGESKYKACDDLITQHVTAELVHICHPVCPLKNIDSSVTLYRWRTWRGCPTVAK